MSDGYYRLYAKYNELMRCAQPMVLHSPEGYDPSGFINDVKYANSKDAHDWLVALKNHLRASWAFTVSDWQLIDMICRAEKTEE